jgi:hypothetical protein
MNVQRFIAAVYRRPYVVIFAAAAGLSAHGLYAAATQLGHIPPRLAWSYVLIVDLLAVSAYRTWRTATEAGQRHWAGAVAAAAAAGTVAMNVIAGHPELAATWAGAAIAGFPPVAALLATALRMAEQRLHPASATTSLAEDRAADLPIPTPNSENSAEGGQPPTTATAFDWLPVPVIATRTLRPEQAALSADASGCPVTAIIVADHLDAGGHITDPQLTATVTDRLGVSDRTARRRLAPYRAKVAA